MASTDDCSALVLAALRRHPRQAMSLTELLAKVRRCSADDPEIALAQLQDKGAVVVQNAVLLDAHFPPVAAVALIEEGPGPLGVVEAQRRANQCLEVLHRQLLRSHRCT